MSSVYDWENTRLFGVPNQIVWVTETQSFNAHKTWALPGKLGRMESPRIHVNTEYLNILQQRELK
jgi:hypothetical protein